MVTFRALCVIPIHFSAWIDALQDGEAFQWDLDDQDKLLCMVKEQMFRLADRWDALTQSCLRIEYPTCVSDVIVNRLQRKQYNKGQCLEITKPQPRRLIGDTAWKHADVRWLWVGLRCKFFNRLKDLDLVSPHANRRGNRIHVLFNADEPFCRYCAVNHEFKEWLIGWMERQGVPAEKLPKSHSDSRFTLEYLAALFVEHLGCGSTGKGC